MKRFKYQILLRSGANRLTVANANVTFGLNVVTTSSTPVVITSSPTISGSSLLVEYYENTSPAYSTLFVDRGRGTKSSPLAVQVGDNILDIQGRAIDPAGNIVTVGGFKMIASNVANGNIQSNTEYYQNDPGSNLKFNYTLIEFNGNTKILNSYDFTAGNSNINLYANALISTTGNVDANNVNANSVVTTGNVDAKGIRFNVASVNANAGTTYNPASDVEQYIFITIDANSGANTFTINCANLDTSGEGKTYKFYVLNLCGNDCNISFANAPQFNESLVDIPNNKYSLGQFDSFGANLGSAVWIYSNVA